jgi:hypothetical protein
MNAVELHIIWMKEKELRVGEDKDTYDAILDLDTLAEVWVGKGFGGGVCGGVGRERDRQTEKET